MVQLHPLGIILGLIFVASIGSLFLWMFRVPPAFPLPVVKVHRSLESVHKILVPIIEAIPSERAVELACRITDIKKSELILLHVMVVPFSLSLNTPMPEREQMARRALDLGQLIAQRYGRSAPTFIIRDRNPVDGILRVARQEQIDAIVLGVGIKPHLPGEWGRTSVELLRRALCEVIVDKVPIDEKLLHSTA